MYNLPPSDLVRSLFEMEIVLSSWKDLEVYRIGADMICGGVCINQRYCTHNIIQRAYTHLAAVEEHNATHQDKLAVVVTPGASEVAVFVRRL